MTHADLENRLQIELDHLVAANNDVFNAAIGVAQAHGDFRWSGSSGIAYAGQAEEMRVDTPIFIASITKMYTAASIMILQEQGLLSINDPISEYLDSSVVEGLHRYKGRDYSDQLRVYHLVSQTSGLPDYFEDTPKDGTSLFDRLIAEGDMEWDFDDVVRISKNDLSPKFPPEPEDQARSGTKAYYSDTNYQLLGTILESVTGKDLQEVYSELILNPFELSATYLHGFKNTPTKTGPPPASFYYKEKPLPLDRAMKSFGPDGGMVSNLEDSLNFIRYFMEGKLFEDPTTVQRMQSWRSIFFLFKYGLGLMRFKLPRIFSPFSATPELVGHSGASSAFLFRSDVGPLYLAGTLNQLDKQRRPFQVMLKLIQIVEDELN